MAYIGVMQGRLLPPQEGRFQAFPRLHWQKEFSFAAKAGLESIEWLYDAYGEDVNPLATDDGLKQMLALSEETGVKVISLCADYFRDRPFQRASQQERAFLVSKMEWLLTRCRAAGITRVVLPLLDNSHIEDASEEREVLAVLEEVLPQAETNKVYLHLETDLGPKAFVTLLAQCQHPFLRVNYDSGNSASWGYDSGEEFEAYGTRIGSVHIKDRKRGSGTVPLGTGDANLPVVFNGLVQIRYDGDYILEAARSVPGDELDWVSQYRASLVNYLEAAGMSGGRRTS